MFPPTFQPVGYVSVESVTYWYILEESLSNDWLPTNLLTLEGAEFVIDEGNPHLMVSNEL